MQSLTKPFGRKGDHPRTIWFIFFLDPLVNKITFFFGSSIHSLGGNLQLSAEHQAKHKKTCLRLLLAEQVLSAGVCGQVQLLPPGPRVWKGQDRHASRCLESTPGQCCVSTAAAGLLPEVMLLAGAMCLPEQHPALENRWKCSHSSVCCTKLKWKAGFTLVASKTVRLL